MKNLLKFALAMLLVTVLALSAGAAEWITKDVTSKLDEAPAWYVEDDAVELEVWDMGDTNANSSATGADGIYPSGYVFLKAKGLGNFEVPFDVEESGNYNIGFVLMAWKKSVPRSTTFSVDGAEPIYVCYDYADEDQYSEQFLTGPTMYLEKGEHTLTLALGEDFDDTNVKSLYFDKFIYAPAGDAPAAEAAPAAGGITTYTEYPDMPGEELLYATADMDEVTGYDAKGGIGVDLMNLASGGTSYCLKRDTSAWYDFEVSERTDVTFYVGYIARTGTNRGLDYAIDDPNGENRIFMDLVESAERQWVSATFTVDAGKHTFYLYAPTGMDDSTLKSCDIYTVELYGTPAAGAAAAEAPAAAASGFTPVGNVTVPFASPSVDGVINAGEYPTEALIIDASNATAGGWVGEVPAANSIELYYAWDNTNLYISGNVTDPAFTTSTDGAYDGDSFQVSLNVNNIFETVDASSRAIFYSWGVQDDGTIDVIRQESAINDTIADTGMGAVTDKGWVFEVALPLEILAEDASLKSGEDIVIEAGTNIGGLFCYLDKDDVMTLINAYATSATETVGWDPAAHGLTFVLEEDQAAAKAAAEAEAAAKAAAEAEAAAQAAAEAEAAAKAAAEAEAAAQAAAEAEAAAQAAAEAAEKPAETVETAPQTFDFGIIAAVSAIVSLMGFTLTRKR